MMEIGSLVVVTRIHKSSSSDYPAVSRVQRFMDNAVNDVLICIGGNSIDEMIQYKRAIENAANGTRKLMFLLVHPWGYFTNSLNQALQFAQDKGYDKIAFQSLEVVLEELTLRLVLQQFSLKTLVVGMFFEGHEFSEGIHDSRGRVCPWNTFAVWDVNRLAITGFPLIGDGQGNCRNIGGVEEVSAIDLLQLIDPTLEAILLKIDSGSQDRTELVWDCGFADPARAEYHDRKMKSKDERPRIQSEISRIPKGKVRHLLVKA